MTNQEMIRKIFKILALIMFIIQFQESIRKYLNSPVVVQISRVSVAEIPPPVVYTCQADQFNFTNARSQGYPYLQAFLIGNLTLKLNNTMKTSWNGKDGNLTYKDLESYMFTHNYTNLNVYDDIDPSMKKTLLLPQGICMKLNITKSKPTISLITKQKVEVIAVDPYKANDVWTEKDPDSVTTIGPHTESLYENGIFELEYTVHDSAIHDGLTCTDYTKTKQTYQECISTLIKQKLSSVYGCLPPWIPADESENICKTEIDLRLSQEMMEGPEFQFLKELLGSREVEMFKQCLLPCVSIKMKLKRTRYDTNFPDNAWISIYSKAWAKKRTDIYSYNGFNFIVDFGSALGLWMGLSCLSILDQILETWVVMQKYWKK